MTLVVQSAKFIFSFSCLSIWSKMSQQRGWIQSQRKPSKKSLSAISIILTYPWLFAAASLFLNWRKVLMEIAVMTPKAAPRMATNIHATIQNPAILEQLLVSRAGDWPSRLATTIAAMILPISEKTILQKILPQFLIIFLKIPSDSVSEGVRKYLWMITVKIFVKPDTIRQATGCKVKSWKEAMTMPLYHNKDCTLIKPSMQTLYFSFYSFVSLEANRIERSIHPERPIKVLGYAEFRRLMTLVVVFKELIEDMVAPAMLKEGQLIKAMTTPMNPNIWLTYDYFIIQRLLSILPLMLKAQIINEHIPLYKKIPTPPPPSNVLSPQIIIAEHRLYPMVMIGAISKQTCQQSNSPTKSNTVRSTDKQANADRMSTLPVI